MSPPRRTDKTIQESSVGMNGKMRPFPAAPIVPRGRRLVAIVWLFTGIVSCLLVAAVLSLGLLSAGRAFVEAQGLWTRAQKEAAFHLTRYTLLHEEGDYDAFKRSIAVPLGDRQARLELEKPHPDLDIVRKGFVQGRIHPGDIESMITLFRLLDDYEPAQRIAALWREADTHITELQEVAREVRSADDAWKETFVARELARINRINSVLTPLEDQIALSLNKAQRTAQAVLLGGMLLLAGLLLAAGIALAKRFVQQNERLQRTLRQSEAQLRHLIESAPLPLLVVRSGDHAILYANDRALQQFALDMDTVRGRSLDEFHVDDATREAMSRALEGNVPMRDYEMQLKDLAGKPSWLLLSAQRLRFGGEDCLLVAAANISDRKHLQEEMRRRAMHDPLTTLPNRAMFVESLERAVGRARRRNTRFSVLFVDLDRFKEVNDTLGHAAGDELLQTMAERLVQAVRQSDLVARMGGDEFVVLIEEHRGPEEVMIVAQKIITMLERPVVIEWKEVAISGSVGIASFPEDGDSAEALLKNADTAMYQAKERGRNNFQFYSEDLNKLTAERFEMERRVRSGLERKEFFLLYQPEVDFASGAVGGVEALVRWRDPSGNLRLPSEFLAHAEETGVILALGRWALEAALADAKAWQEQGIALAAAVNISARQLHDADLVNHVFRALQASGIAARMLRIEVPESALVGDLAAADRTLRGLRGLGVDLVLDNFGAGQASLGLLTRFGFRAVKIDRGVLAASAHKRDAAALVAGVVTMARELGVRVVAEGIETEEQRRHATSLGLAAGQGFLFGKPVEASRVPRLVSPAPAPAPAR
jgi:diguanylate cyclase (GGDEF)-like protein/PAS domain S-box-containing protein